MLQKIGMFSFDIRENGGKIDENIIKMFVDAGYKVSQSSGGKYFIFKENTEENDNSNQSTNVIDETDGVDDEF